MTVRDKFVHELRIDMMISGDPEHVERFGLECMRRQAELCAKALEEQGYIALSPITNAGTEEV